MIETDVLVIGSGGAGLRASIEADSKDVTTILVTKGAVDRSGATPLAGADIMLDGRSLHGLGYPGDSEDSPEKFFRDICIEGFYLNNQKLVQNYVDEAPARVKELLDWGMHVAASDDREVLTSGVEIVNALYRELKRRNVEIIEDMMICELLTNENQITGAIGVDLYTGDLVVFKAKAIILATGGWQKAYPFNSIMGEMSGDGQAMAFRAGAELSYMEMVTFCPNVILTPQKMQGNIFFYILHSSCGTILNSDGEGILAKYDSKIAEIATKTEWNKLLLSLYSMREVREGKGSPMGGVFYSLQGVPWETVEKSGMALFSTNWKFQGTDFRDLMNHLKEGVLVEVGPACHYVEGGVRVNERYEATIQGLYAAGECKSGTFGANRVSAATTEMLIEGVLAGQFAADYAKAANTNPIDSDQLTSLKQKLLKPFDGESGVQPSALKRKMHEIAAKSLGVIRTGETLKSAINKLEEMRKKELPTLYLTTKSRAYNLEWIDALELENMIQVLELSAKSALMRTESRGVHYRLDYPNIDHDSWLKEIVVKQVAGEVQVTMHPVIVTGLTPPKGKLSFEQAILDAIERLNE